MSARSFHNQIEPAARRYNNDAVGRMNLNQSMVWREPPVQQHPPVKAVDCNPIETAPSATVANLGHPYDTRRSQVEQAPYGHHPSFSYQ
jgi:hypothetical protein